MAVEASGTRKSELCLHVRVLHGLKRKFQIVNSYRRRSTSQECNCSFQFLDWPGVNRAHARIGVAAGGAGFPVSGPGGRVDVSVSGNGERANSRRGPMEAAPLEDK